MTTPATPVETVSRWLERGTTVMPSSEVRDAIAAIVKAERERAWLPIETAPRDGTRILVLRPSRVPGQKQAIRSRVVIAKWHNGKWHKESMAGSKNSTPAYAIAWMPLPSNEGNYIFDSPIIPG